MSLLLGGPVTTAPTAAWGGVLSSSTAQRHHYQYQHQNTRQQQHLPSSASSASIVIQTPRTPYSTAFDWASASASSSGSSSSSLSSGSSATPTTPRKHSPRERKQRFVVHDQYDHSCFDVIPDKSPVLPPSCHLPPPLVDNDHLDLRQRRPSFPVEKHPHPHHHRRRPSKPLLPQPTAAGTDDFFHFSSTTTSQVPASSEVPVRRTKSSGPSKRVSSSALDLASLPPVPTRSPKRRPPPLLVPLAETHLHNSDITVLDGSSTLSPVQQQDLVTMAGAAAVALRRRTRSVPLEQESNPVSALDAHRRSQSVGGEVYHAYPSRTVVTRLRSGSLTTTSRTTNKAPAMPQALTPMAPRRALPPPPIVVPSQAASSSKISPTLLPPRPPPNRPLPACPPQSCAVPSKSPRSPKSRQQQQQQQPPVTPSLTPAEQYREDVSAIREAEWWDWPIPPPISMRDRPRRPSQGKLLGSKPSLPSLVIPETSSLQSSSIDLPSMASISRSESLELVGKEDDSMYEEESSIDFSAAPLHDYGSAKPVPLFTALGAFPWETLHVENDSAPLMSTTYQGPQHHPYASHQRGDSDSTDSSLFQHRSRRTNSSGPSSELGPLTPDETHEDPFDRPPPLPPKPKRSADARQPARARYGVPF